MCDPVHIHARGDHPRVETHGGKVGLAPRLHYSRANGRNSAFCGNEVSNARSANPRECGMESPLEV